MKTLKEIVIIVLASCVFCLVCWGIYSKYKKPALLEVNILGPAVVQTNDLTFLEASEEADLYVWVVVPEGTQQRTLESGKLLALSFKIPGQYTVILGVGKGGKVAFAKHVITVNGDIPIPPEPDNDWAEWAHRTALATVISPDRASQATTIASQLRSVAAKIAAGAISTPKEARVSVRVALNQALGNDVMAWTGFSTKFSEHCMALEKTGDLRTVKQYRIIYLGVAKGLDAVKRNTTCGNTTCNT